MKKVFIKILLILIFISSGIALAGITLQYFTAHNQGEGVLIEWKTGDESGTSVFDIERAADSPGNFIFLKSINATGNNSYYSYLDNSVYSSPNGNNTVYYYRLKCIKPDGSYSYSNSITVVHTISGIRSTWGSIKAIFR